MSLTVRKLDANHDITHVMLTGDTRDTTWVSECRCVGLDQPIPSRKGMPISSTPDGDIL